MISDRQRITSIDVQEKKRNRRSIFLDGKFALGVDESTVADFGLRVGQEIGAEDLERIVRAELVAKAREKALRLLQYRQRSKAEIARRLNRDGFAEEIVGEVLARLESLGLVDDVRFSRSWVSSRLAGRGAGVERIKWELRRKGVSADVVEEALSEVDPETEYRSAVAAARGRWESDKDGDERRKRRKLSSFLRRRGFDWDVITRAVNEVAAGAQPD